MNSAKPKYHQLGVTSIYKKKEFISLSLIAVVSIAIRLHANFGAEYIPGGNGAYYLVMVRSLLENGKLSQPDFPLLFWLEAAVSFIVIKLGLTNFNSAIDFTSRIFDSVIPVSSIIPAYLLTKKLLHEKKDWKIPVLISAASILYFSFLILVSDFQKNSLGLLWLFCLIYFLLRVHEKAKLGNILGSASFLILTGITHYGCIAVGLTIIIVDLLSRHFFQYTFKRFLKIIFLLIIGVGISIGLMYLINPWRVRTFIEIPFEILKNPILFLLIRKEPILSPLDLLSMVFINGLGFSSLVIFIKRYKEVSEKHRSFIFSMIFLLLFLSSPFLNYEFAQRIYFVSYPVAIPVMSFLYNSVRKEANKKYFTLLLSTVIFSSVIIVTAKPNYSNMNRNIYSEMTKIKNIIPIDDKSVIIARHGMEFWSSWVWGCVGLRQESVGPVYWMWYKNVFILHQKKDKSLFGPAGIYGNPFPEPELIEKSFLVYSSEYFDLYRAPNAPIDFEKYNRSKH